MLLIVKLTLLCLLFVATFTFPLTSCSNECSNVISSSEEAKSQMLEEFKRANEEYVNSPQAAGREGPNWKMVPFIAPSGEKAYLITDKPILEKYYKLRQIWLKIQVNNPNCYDAKDIANAQIELKNY